ncbi:MAG: hypothetical protein M0D55_03960 [Elusimicrobiota bacterium]|nr:MAG: hypothetical protein M0D55_03960 [Elusimicrobiota bacterium]
MKIALLFVSLAAAAPAAPKPAEWLVVRAADWDSSWKPKADREWAEKLVAVVSAAAKDGVDALVFAEGFSAGRCPEDLLPSLKGAAGPDMLVALGVMPCKEKGSAVARTWVYSSGGWAAFDKIDPTPAERAAKPPVKPGTRLVLFRWRGGLASVLPSYSAQKPELAAALKKRGVSLLLVPVPAEDDDGWRRVTRAASARAVELGAAVVLVPPSAPPTLYLPAQKGFEPALAAGARDVRVPWRRLLELRSPPAGSTEARPFLDPATYYQVEF